MRSLLGGMAAVATYFFLFWVGAGLLSLVLPIVPATVTAGVLAAVAAAAASRFIRQSNSRALGLGRAMGRGALILGAIGFVGGFFGPIIFTPGANQGPLLGLFITGPAGIVLGGIAGAIWWFLQTKGGPDQV